MIGVSLSELESYWSGIAYIPYKNFLGFSDKITLSSKNDSVITLKILLHDLGYKEIEISPFYDLKTQKIVKKFRKKTAYPLMQS